MIRRRLARLAGLAAAVMTAASQQTLAQCSMCAQSAQAAGAPDVVAKTFNLAILALMIPVAAFLIAVGLLLWRFRGDLGGVLEQPPGPAAALPAASPAVAALPLRGARSA